jgi:hypothetical protein
MQQRLPEVEALLNKLGGTLGRPSFYVSYPDAFQDPAFGRVDFVIANVVPITDLICKRPNEFELGEAVATFLALSMCSRRAPCEQTGPLSSCLHRSNPANTSRSRL